jgi:DNA repair protein RadC
MDSLTPTVRSPDGHTSPTLIRDMPAGDRPRERLRDYGPRSLSVAELIAILLRTGSSKESALAQANRLMRDFKDLTSLRQAPFGELAAVHGIGEAKASQIQAALELGVRLARSPIAERPVIKSPDDAADYVMADMSVLDREELWVLPLDTRNHVLSTVQLYKGSVHTTSVRLGEVFREAVRLTAAAIVVVHNHPSGDPAPSANDIAMTKMLCEAGKLLDIDIVDHVVIGGTRFVSMRNARLGFDGDFKAS